MSRGGCSRPESGWNQ
eukprot:gene26921-biopygen17502